MTAITAEAGCAVAGDCRNDAVGAGRTALKERCHQEKQQQLGHKRGGNKAEQRRARARHETFLHYPENKRATIREVSEGQQCYVIGMEKAAVAKDAKASQNSAPDVFDLRCIGLKSANTRPKNAEEGSET